MADLHKFEARGLGKAPFSFKRVQYNSQGTKCDYCGTKILYEFWCCGTDLQEFKVGSECIFKIESRHGQLYQDVERANNAIKKEIGAKKLEARITSAQAHLEIDPKLFCDRKHPFAIQQPWNEFFKKKTMRDYLEFLFSKGGDSGKTRACKIVEEWQKEHFVS